MTARAGMLVLALLVVQHTPSCVCFASGGMLYRPSLPTLPLGRSGTAPVAAARTAYWTRRAPTSMSTDGLNSTHVPQAPTLRALVSFVGPCLGSALTSEVMSLVDTAVVGRMSVTALASLAPAVLVADTSAFTFYFLTIATTSLVAGALARDDSRGAFDAVASSLALALALGLGTALVLAVSSRAVLTLALGQAATPAILADALGYLRVRLIGLPLTLCTMVMQAALQGMRDPLSPLLAIVGGGSLNFALDMLLCFGLRMGVVGAAIATVASQFVQTAVLLLALLRQRRRLCPERTGLLAAWPAPRVLRRYLNYAGPIFFVIQGKILCYNSMTLAVTASGVTALAAHQVAATIFFTACRLGDALSQTVQAFLPASLTWKGRVTPATKQLAKRAVVASVCAGLVGASLACAAATVGARLFTADAAVLAGMASVAPLLWASLALHTPTMVGEGVLLAMRDLNYLVGGYAVNIFTFVSGLLLVKQRALGIRAVWAALFCFQGVRFAQFYLRAVALGAVPSGPRAWRAATKMDDDSDDSDASSEDGSSSSDADEPVHPLAPAPQ